MLLFRHLNIYRFIPSGPINVCLLMTGCQTTGNAQNTSKMTPRFLLPALALSLALPLSQWLQQYCVEQCAVLLALSERMPSFTSNDDLPCQLGRADGYKAPQLCMGCARWWTEHGHASWNDQPYLFDRLVRDWRRTERPAAIVLAKKHPQGDLLFQLIQPFLQLPPMATHFPCTRAKLGAFIEEISVGERESTYTYHNGEEVFNGDD